MVLGIERAAILRVEAVRADFVRRLAPPGGVAWGGPRGPLAGMYGLMPTSSAHVHFRCA
jgi:hypothetical protein